VLQDTQQRTTVRRAHVSTSPSPPPPPPRHRRYGLILAERLLRQFIATPLLGRGPRFRTWLQQAHASSSPLLLVLKLSV
jgi:hypothetical protein